MTFDTFTAISVNGFIGNKKTGSAVFREYSTVGLMEYRDEVRTSYDAICVGVNTLLKDNPSLLTSRGNFRIVFDRYQNLPLDLKIFTVSPDKTIVFLDKANTSYHSDLQTLGIHVVVVDDMNDFEAVCSSLSAFNIKKVMIEGGSKIIETFVKANQVDKILLVTFPVLLDPDNSVPFIGNLDKNFSLTLVSSEIVDGQFVVSSYLKRAR